MTQTVQHQNGAASAGTEDRPGLDFVDPTESDETFRVVLWASPGEGKSVGAASAPGPLLVLSADRPGAYRFARRFHAPKTIRETRYVNSATLTQVFRFLRDGADAEDATRTLILDPFTGVYDKLVEEIGGTNPQPEHYQTANRRLLGFLHGLRPFGLHVVLVAHERLNDGRGGDGKLYPALGGPALINKVLAEMDVVAHVEREVSEDGQHVRYMGQLGPRGNLVAKESTGALGDRRLVDLTEWFETAANSFRQDEDDAPWEKQASAPSAQSVSADPPQATEVLASARQRGKVMGQASDAGLSSIQLANAIRVAKGDEPREFDSAEAATTSVQRDLDRLPARLVDAVLEQIASSGAPA